MAIDVNGDGVVDENDLNVPITGPGNAFDAIGSPLGTRSDLGFESSRYDFTYRVFPENLGDEENSHYMILNINVPVSVTTSIFQPGVININPAGDLPAAPFTGQSSKVDSLRFAELGQLNLNQGGGRFGRVATKRITAAIALHMPNGGLIFTDDNKYEEVSMTALAGSVVSGAAGLIDKRLGGATGGVLGGLVGSVVDAIKGVVTNGAKVLGNPINPMVEVIFATRPQRQWMFEVLLAPRTPTEAETVREIIRTIRYYAAPELMLAGTVYIPPAEFDITFYRNGVENTYLPRINTCVLEKIDIDYAPADGKYATFRNGAPVAVRLSLGFRELEITHKARVYQGF